MNTIEQAQEVAKRLRSLMGSWPLPQEAAGTIDALIAELAALKGQEPVGSVTSSPWRGLENIEWQQSGDIPEGTHMLYLAAGAQPAQEKKHGFSTIEPEDFKVEVLYKPTGGGFAPISSNGVRVTHILSGMSTDCESERSQYANREKAMKTLLEVMTNNTQPAPKQDQCWCDATGIGEPGVSCGDCPKDYAAPVQAQERKPLTEKEIHHIWRGLVEGEGIEEFARAIEAKIKEQP